MSTAADDSPLLAEDLLLLDRFDFREHGIVSVASLTDLVDATPEQIREFLDELAKKHYLSQIVIPAVPALSQGAEVYWEATSAGYVERERLLRLRRERHPAVDGTSFNILSLVLALLMAGQIENGRLTGGMLGRASALTTEELKFYLPKVDASELADVIEGAERSGLLRKSQKLQRKNGTSTFEHVDALEVTEKGRKLYRTDAAKELGLNDRESILDAATLVTIELFNSWQSEHNPSRTAIGKALRRVIMRVNGLKGLWRPLSIVEATAPGDGAARIDVALLTRIRAAHLFVADLTPVAEHDGRLCPNDNVLVEVGYALASKEPEQIILVSKRRPELESGGARLAFDIAHVRRHPFDAASDLEARLLTEITAILQRRNWLT